MRDIIAKIIDPHSFLPDNSGCDLTAEMVKQGKSLAYSKTDRIFEALASVGLPDEPTRSPLTGRDEMIFGACSQCGTRQHLARTEDGGFICGSCSDANYLAEWIHYSREMRRLACLAPLPNASAWQPMDTAPTDGKHCYLAMQSGAFVWAVQGAFMQGSWCNAADIPGEPLCWMPKPQIPDEFCPWTDAFKARAGIVNTEDSTNGIR